MFNIKEKIRACRDGIISLISILRLKKILKHEKKCLLISNGSTLSGAPLVLLEAAKTLRNNGYFPIFFSEFMGPVLRVAKKEKIAVVVGSCFKKFLKTLLSTADFEIIIINTVVYYEWVNSLSNSGKHIIWWLHEGKTYIDNVLPNLPKVLPDNVDVYCVSTWTEKALKNEGIKYKYGILNYGCADLRTQVTRGEGWNFDGNLLKVAIIGNICSRKNQIGLIEFLESLEQPLLDKFQFIFVGTPLSSADSYYNLFLDRLDAFRGNKKYIKGLSREKMPDFYQEMDIILCCSIDDPLPVVITEGMMFGKIVISSSCTGHYDVIQEGVNGFKFEINQFSELGLIFDYIERNKNRMDEIGRSARKTYEELFTPDAFEKKLLSIVNKK